MALGKPSRTDEIGDVKLEIDGGADYLGGIGSLRGGGVREVGRRRHPHLRWLRICRRRARVQMKMRRVAALRDAYSLARFFRGSGYGSLSPQRVCAV